MGFIKEMKEKYVKLQQEKKRKNYQERLIKIGKRTRENLLQEREHKLEMAERKRKFERLNTEEKEFKTKHKFRESKKKYLPQENFFGSSGLFGNQQPPQKQGKKGKKSPIQQEGSLFEPSGLI